MKRIICHWTAGGHKASSVDKKHYHFLIEGDGAVVNGDHPVSANERVQGTRYAAHTRGCNTGSIGVSLCCMMGAVESPFSSGKAPMLETQWKKLVKLVAQLCREYDIPVSDKTVLSHAEVEKNLGIKQRGKWDYTRLSFDSSVVGAKACGDKLRREVLEELGKGVK